ncbi:hypothetical protein [Acetivibrio cellulolyticus]|uniref:hypothetical protein n=1 Tax=Acetivibrio cellulolyticus TaxID=35830 RepID=UPI0001E2C294|nr:hypothetical protein [Acetivibrio cellulolyticus]
MLEIYKVITSKLKQIPKLANQKQFININVNKASLPMAIVTIPNIIEPFQHRQDLTLEINCWSSSSSDKIIELEGIVSAIDQKLNRYKELNNNLQISIYRDSVWRNNIPEPDESLFRVKLNYVLQVYYIN